MADELARIPFFGDLGRRHLNLLSESLRLRTYKAGETIFDQGAPSVAAYIVRSGLIEIIQDDGNGTKMQLSEAAPGTLLGETALLDDAPRTASAVVADDAEVAVFYRSELFRLAEEQTDLAVKIVLQLSQVVAERLRRTNRALREVRGQVEAVEATGAGPEDGKGGETRT